MNRFVTFPLSLFLFFSVSGWMSAQELSWKTDVELAKQSASENNKLILLHFSADWCRPCKQLEKFVFTSPRVIAKINERLETVYVDTDLNPALLKQFSITEIPADVVITPSGRVVSKRKSPKTTDDYIRMIDTLPVTEIASQQENLELTQKIDQVLAAANAGTQVAKDNDFTPAKANHAAPNVAREGAILANKATALTASVSPGQTQLVSHQAPSSDTSETAEHNDDVDTAGKSKRVINDTFFVEKSNFASSMPGGENQFQPATSRARLKNVENETSQNSSLQPHSNQNAAKILTPNFGGPNSTSKAAQIENENQSLRLAQSDSNSFPAAVPSNSKLASEKSLERTDSSASQVAELALSGKCPVTLIQEGKWAAGDPQFGCVHRGRTYLFTNQSKLTLFQQQPDAFSPVLAGYDPVLFHDKGALVDGKAKHGVFMGKSPKQRIVLFQSSETRAKFQADPESFMKTVRMAVEQANRTLR